MCEDYSADWTIGQLGRLLLDKLVSPAHVSASIYTTSVHVVKFEDAVIVASTPNRRGEATMTDTV